MKSKTNPNSKKKVVAPKSVVPLLKNLFEVALNVTVVTPELLDKARATARLTHPDMPDSARANVFAKKGVWEYVAFAW